MCQASNLDKRVRLSHSAPYMTFEEAIKYLEKFPDYRTPCLRIEYRRLDDFRRAAVIKNGNSLVQICASLSIWKTAEEISKETKEEKYKNQNDEYGHFDTIEYSRWADTLEKAIEEVIKAVNKWIEETAKRPSLIDPKLIKMRCFK